VRGDTPLAVVIVDREGRPVPDRCAVVSSFAWGLPQAIAGDLAALGAWKEAGARIEGDLHKRLYLEEEDGRPAPLTRAMIDAAYVWLIETLGLDVATTRTPAFAVRTPVPYRQQEPPEPLLLNSFYLGDLAAATGLVREGRAPDTLRRFLGQIAPGERRDLLHDEVAIEDALAPARFPLGRWPGPGRHPLVLMQQAAVNLALGQGQGEILAVNGPPGTGKTTLLRDIVAGLVTERAEVMAQFDDPAQAFTHSGQRLNTGGGWMHLYRLDDRLKGFEMLVASSNNKAVENVSRELPAIGAVAADATDLRYLKPLADAMLGAESWGAIAAVLGNGRNRSAFRDRFWWDEDTGLRAYLKAADGGRPEVDEGGGRTRPPRIVTQLAPPGDGKAALLAWRKARERFRLLSAEVAAKRAWLEQLRMRLRVLPVLEQAFKAVAAHGAERPGLLSRLSRGRRAREWARQHRPLSEALVRAIGEARAADLLPRDAIALRLSRSPWFGFRPELRAKSFEAALTPLLEALHRDRSARNAPVLDAAFYAQADRGVQQQAAPWFTAEEHRLRDTLFAAATDVHRAFLDAAARPMRHNLGLALKTLDGRGLGDPEKDALIPDLWSSLFLVVPVLSTTFASVATMLARVPPASIGWLLVDEAGQAAPQQAVGALMRCRRAVVVGDPIQVPPVVPLPEQLTAAICRTFGVDQGRFAAPAASVQTLADDATRWFAEFGAGDGTRKVGVPLLVHRRCAAPMFGIANRIAYDGLMVPAKAPSRSPILDLLGPSRWLHVAGSGAEKWCEAEGEVAVAMIERILGAGLTPDLYVVTPFVAVAEGLRRRLEGSAALAAAVDDVRRWAGERVGTVHTVQGREAEAVILVLGAPEAGQTGARGWAGREPNLLNVAVTRAKEALYVIGHRERWRAAGVFATLDRMIP
jgi:energy-coupling factor transporter ATP-binding protein EcfA2